ncbi:MAG TPA: hypothetical protein ENH10_01855 [Bacteroidetes bacterium]|nr:hypothetical protein BMS3Bbin04_01086 [bacterium BMS3Bbin04]HDO64762.1 hypothetical protein [Bacteroidota bacterium]HEX03887.1 hypothetical protein [Bacteroidota bacterium]
MRLTGWRFRGLYCPMCDSRNIRRSTRNSYFEQKILPLIGAYPYRCRDCSNRFFVRVRNHKQSTSETSFVQSETDTYLHDKPKR